MLLKGSFSVSEHIVSMEQYLTNERFIKDVFPSIRHATLLYDSMLGLELDDETVVQVKRLSSYVDNELMFVVHGFENSHLSRLVCCYLPKASINGGTEIHYRISVSFRSPTPFWRRFFAWRFISRILKRKHKLFATTLIKSHPPAMIL